MADVNRPVIDQLTEARRRGLTVFIDNDHISAHDEATDEDVVGAHPHDVMLALLEHFGVRAESV